MPVKCSGSQGTALNKGTAIGITSGTEHRDDALDVLHNASNDEQERCQDMRGGALGKIISYLRIPYPLSTSLCCLAFAFLVAGVIGWVYEIICGLLNGEGFNYFHGGLGIPFLTLYGSGAVIIELFFGLGRRDFNIFAQFAATALLCTIVELITGEFMLHVIGVQTWTYLLPGWDFLASPDGIICLRASLTFGAFGVLLLRCVNPLFVRIWNSGGWKVLCIAIGALMTLVILAILNVNVLHVIDVGTQWQ